MHIFGKNCLTGQTYLIEVDPNQSVNELKIQVA